MAHSHAMKAKFNIIIPIITNAMKAKLNKSVVILGSSFLHAHNEGTYWLSLSFLHAHYYNILVAEAHSYNMANEGKEDNDAQFITAHSHTMKAKFYKL